MHKFIYDWLEIQKYYDTGVSLAGCREKFGFGTTAGAKAVKAGRLLLRSHEEASALKRKKDLPQITENKFSDTTGVGEIACAKFDLFAIENGLIVSRPNIECCYDRIVDWHNKLFRVQVKYAGQKANGVIVAKTTRTCRNRGVKVAYNENELDSIVVYSPKTNKLYWLPKEIWNNKTGVSLRLTKPQNTNGIPIRYAKDFEWTV